MTHGGTHPDKLDFSASVNPLGLHPAAREALLSLARDSTPLERYPNSESTELCEQLAAFWSAGGQSPEAALEAANVVCGAGAADLIYALVQAFARPAPHAAVVIVEPAFSEYARAAKAVGATVRRVVLAAESGFTLTDADVSRLEAALSDSALLFMASPANPTSVVADSALLCRLAALCEAHGTLFVLDACFSQFSAHAESAVRALLLRRATYPHTVVLNAFTKFYGMAGLRLGYALCASSAVSEQLRAVLRPWAVGAVEQAAGSAVLRAELAARSASLSDWETNTRTLIATERARLTAALHARGYGAVTGDANFVLFRAALPESESRLCARLLSRGIAIRSCADFCGLDAHCYRIAIRTAAENTQLLAALP